MNFTQQQLESMSDLQLNIIAANHFYDCGDITVAQSSGDDVEVICNGVIADVIYNPCQRWSDCGDLIDEIEELEDVGLGVGCGMCSYTSDYTYLSSEAGTTKRSVVVIYAIIKQGKSNEN